MMSHDGTPVNFLSDIQPSEKSWDTHRAEAESVRCFTVFRLSSPNTLAVFMIVPKS